MILDLSEYDADVLVSTNECVTNRGIIKWLKHYKIKLEDIHLPIGDYLIRGNPNVLVERKKVSDWLQSQRDGRMYNQKKDMIEGTEGVIPVIIIHGHFKQVSGHRKRWKPQQVCGTLANTIFSDIQHITVPDDEWFARTIKSIINLVTKEKEWKPRPVTLKPRVTTDEEWGLNVLMAVDKVGPIAATKLAIQFDTVSKAIVASEQLLQQTIGNVTGSKFFKVVNTSLEKYCRERQIKKQQ